MDEGLFHDAAVIRRVAREGLLPAPVRAGYGYPRWDRQQRRLDRGLAPPADRPPSSAESHWLKEVMSWTPRSRGGAPTPPED